MEVREFLAKIGKKGGLIGGKTRMESMTSTQRKALAKKAAAASAKVRSAKARAKRKEGK